MNNWPHFVDCMGKLYALSEVCLTRGQKSTVASWITISIGESSISLTLITDCVVQIWVPAYFDGTVASIFFTQRMLRHLPLIICYSDLQWVCSSVCSNASFVAFEHILVMRQEFSASYALCDIFFNEFRNFS